jgi:hypothetical protein
MSCLAHRNHIDFVPIFQFQGFAAALYHQHASTGSLVGVVISDTVHTLLVSTLICGTKLFGRGFDVASFHSFRVIRKD